MKELKDMTVTELKEYAAASNIPLDKLRLKPEILERIEATLKERAGEPAAALGEQPPTDTTTAPTGAPEGIPQAGQDPSDAPEGQKGANKTEETPPEGTGEQDSTGEPAAAPGEQLPINTHTGAPDAPSDINCITIDRVLKCTKPFIKGDDVKAVQAALIALKFHCGVEGANGVYNASTALAVRMFQSHNRLIVSGKVEKFTAQALGAKWEEPKQ